MRVRVHALRSMLVTKTTCEQTAIDPRRQTHDLTTHLRISIHTKEREKEAIGRETRERGEREIRERENEGEKKEERLKREGVV